MRRKYTARIKEQHYRTRTLPGLPKDILLEMAGYLEADALKNTAATCRTMHVLIYQHFLRSVENPLKAQECTWVPPGEWRAHAAKLQGKKELHLTFHGGDIARYIRKKEQLQRAFTFTLPQRNAERQQAVKEVIPAEKYQEMMVPFLRRFTEPMLNAVRECTFSHCTLNEDSMAVCLPFPHLRKLTFSFCTLNDASLTALFPRFPALTSLSLIVEQSHKALPRLTDKGMESVVRYGKNLSELTLGGVRITDKTIEALSHLSLHTLELHGCHAVRLLSINPRCRFRHLRKLVLQDMWHIPAKHFGAFVEACPHVNDLHIVGYVHGQGSFTDKYLKMLAMHAGKFERVTFEACEQMKEEEIGMLATHQSGIKEIIFKKSLITDACFPLLFAFSSLQKLAFEQCGNITKKGLEQFASSCKSLKELKVNGLCVRGAEPLPISSDRASSARTL